MKGCFGIIYRVTNIINGKVYIGQTVEGLIRRRWSHESKAILSKSPTYFWRAVKKYGKENFEWKILEYCNSKEELDLAEEWYIRCYKTFVGFDDCCGYNCTLGGEGSVGFKHTKEVCELITKQKTGVKLSKESIERRSLLQSKDWLIVFPSGEESVIRNLSKFCRENDLSPGAMYGVSQGERNHHKNFRCVRLLPFNRKTCSKETRQMISEKNKGKRNTKEQSERQLDIQSKYWLITFPNGQEKTIKNLNRFCRKYVLSPSLMHRLARGERKTHKGFKCKKLDTKLDNN